MLLAYGKLFVVGNDYSIHRGKNKKSLKNHGPKGSVWSNDYDLSLGMALN